MAFEELSSKTKTETNLRKRFGQYLVEHNIVPTEAVEQALAHQKNKTPLIGKLAHTEKMMSIEQVFQVLNVQHVDNRRFGELAVELGFLRKVQVKTLLERQQQSRPKIGEVLVERNELDHRTLNKHLDTYLKG